LIQRGTCGDRVVWLNTGNPKENATGRYSRSRLFSSVAGRGLLLDLDLGAGALEFLLGGIRGVLGDVLDDL